MPIEINGTGSIVGVDSLSTPAVTNAAGSASAPSITFTGDSNTGIYSPAADTIAFTEGGVESVRIDSSGRVGIGTSSPDSSLTITKDAAVGINIRSADANFSSLLFGCDTVSGFNFITSSTSGSGTLRPISFRMGASEAFRVDTSGRVGIGDNAPGTFDVRGAKLTLADSVSDGIGIKGRRDSLDRWYVGYNSSDQLEINQIRNNALAFKTNNAEVARLTNSGQLLVGTSSRLISDERNRLSVDSGSGTFVSASFKNDAGANANTVDIWNAATSGNNNFITFFTEASSTSRGSIDYNRSAGQVRYNVTSDRRLKSEIQPAGTALTALASIQVRSYKWTETGYQVEHGFIAQELNGVVPDAVKTGDDNDEVTETWAVDNAKLVPLLTKALQEALEKIETLETKVAALESA